MASSPYGGQQKHPRKILNAVSAKHNTSPVLIGIVATYPPCGPNASLQVANKHYSSSPGLVGQTQKLEAVFDGKFPDDLDSTSISSKVIGHKISNGSSGDLYTRFRMNFADDTVKNQTPQFMNLGLSTINAFYESSALINPTTII